MLFFLPILLQNFITHPPPLQVTHASSEGNSEWKQESITIQEVSKRHLFYFTHSQEAYPGVGGKEKAIPVYHPSENITNFAPDIERAFESYGIEAGQLEVDTMQLLSKHQKGFDQAYATVRPYVKEALQTTEYDVVIDFHRDSAPRTVTTLDERYAKVLFIVGGEHANYAGNKKLAETISQQMETNLPGISRGVIIKQGRGVDGVYNQDLHPRALLIELGGIENTPEEVRATIEQLAKALGAL